MTWREYHEATKHTEQSLRRAQYTLDWANMPDPFRHYEGVPVLDLPADPPPLEVPALELLLHSSGDKICPADAPTFLSQLLFYSAAISATKRVPSTGYRYALRVNPSSGNLHPTEFHFVTRGMKDWPDGLYHYRPSSHMAEQRARGGLKIDADSPAPLVFVLTSIAWREAWKYRERAYRYCLLDIGHAWQSLVLAAGAVGCRTITNANLDEDEIARFLRLNEDEWPMLVVSIPSASAEACNADSANPVWFGGEANQLSPDRITYPLIDGIHAATKPEAAARTAPVQSLIRASSNIKLPPPALSSQLTFGQVARKRRSALDFQGGDLSISLEELSATLVSSTRGSFIGSSRFVQLYIYAHRVSGLDAGVYRYWPSDELEIIKRGDQRVAAAGLSLGQDLAGNACVAFSMIADLERATASYGNRGYRYVHFEAGAMGQCIYLTAEALGLGATGIGAFFDDKVHAYLNITPGQGQVIYHFAIGYPVPDPRLSSGGN